MYVTDMADFCNHVAASAVWGEEDSVKVVLYVLMCEEVVRPCDYEQNER